MIIIIIIIIIILFSLLLLYCIIFILLYIHVIVFHVKTIIPSSGKFSPGKNFAKAGSVVFRKNFGRFIFAHTRRAKINSRAFNKF